MSTEHHYESIPFKRELAIDRIIFIRCFESENDFIPEEESHDFRTFLWVNKGSFHIVSGSASHTLNKDDILFCRPGEPYHICADGAAPSGLLFLGFECGSPAMDFFQGKRLETGPSERTLLGNIMKEARLAYSCPSDDPRCRQLIRNSATSVPFGSEQLIQIYLQQLLIQLIRNNSADSAFAAIPKSARERGNDELFYKITSYMEEHINEHLSVQQICRDNLIGRSLLQQIFRDHTGYGVIDYFSLMKINAAKRLIRSRQMNFSRIAEHLGYNSIHYFSRQFKKLAEMTPSEYAASVRPAAEQPESAPEPPSPDHNGSQNAGHIPPHKDT